MINTSHEAIEWMSTSKGGRGGIVANISSISGVLFFKHNPVYSATKHGILAFTKCMGVSDTQPIFKAISNLTYFTFQNDITATLHGIHFLTICPGITDTSIITDNVENRFRSELQAARVEWLMETPHQTLVYKFITIYRAKKKRTKTNLNGK